MLTLTKLHCNSCKSCRLECGYDAVDLRKARHTVTDFSALTDYIEHLEDQL